MPPSIDLNSDSFVRRCPAFWGRVRKLRWTVVAAALSCVTGGLWAQTPPGAASDLSVLSQRWLDNALRNNPAGKMPLRMEVTVGTLDPRLNLAPCARVEPYLPAGSTLWGRTRIGLRCVEGPVPWNVYLPVTVKAMGLAWVLNGNVASGAVLRAEDASQAEVDWAADPSSVLANPDLWVGKIASRPLQGGQALRQSMVRAPYIFQAGAQVRVVARGVGYSVTSTGQALSAGAVGQTVRIRVDNGRIINGTVNEDGTVDASL